MTTTYKILVAEPDYPTGKGEALAPQAVNVHKALVALAGEAGEIERKDFLTRIYEEENHQVLISLNTSQSVQRVLSFYQGDLAKLGYIEIVKVKPEPKEKAAPKEKQVKIPRRPEPRKVTEPGDPKTVKVRKAKKVTAAAETVAEPTDGAVEI